MRHAHNCEGPDSERVLSVNVTVFDGLTVRPVPQTSLNQHLVDLVMLGSSPQYRRGHLKSYQGCSGGDEDVSSWKDGRMHPCSRDMLIDLVTMLKGIRGRTVHDSLRWMERGSVVMGWRTREQKNWRSRDGANLIKNSCGISRWDPIPRAEKHLLHT